MQNGIYLKNIVYCSAYYCPKSEQKIKKNVSKAANIFQER